MALELEIRRIRPDEDARVRELNRTAMAETPEWIDDGPEPDLQDVEGTYLVDGSEFLVGVHEGRIVATGAYTPPHAWKGEYLDVDDETAELTRMRVAPEWQGRGVGRSMYAELARRARADGYRRFVLDTGAENDAARGFYEGLGFRCVREVALEYRGSTVELALYEKRIGD